MATRVLPSPVFISATQPKCSAGAAHDLHVEVALAERAPTRLADRGEGLGEELVEVVDPGLEVVAGRCRRGVAEVTGERAQLVVGASLHLGLVRVHLGHERLEQLELLALAGVQQLLEETHVGSECTGGLSRSRPVTAAAAPRSASMTR